MLWPWPLRRAAWLLSLCLLTPCHLYTAGSLSLGEEAHPGDTVPKPQNGPAANEVPARSLPGTGPGAEGRQGSQDDLFQDVDPKALAAVLLQALRAEPQKPAHRRRDPEQPSSANEETVESQTQSSELEPEGEPGWKARKDNAPPQEEGEEESPEDSRLARQEAERLKEALLEELRQASPAAKREAPSQDRQAAAAAAAAAPQDAADAVLKDLEEYEQLRVNTKRKAPPSEPWVGARKLRQQQHLEHQLLQRRYEELAESRRQAEEARRAAAEEERLADMASDLLLQYLLKDGEEEEEEERQGANAREETEEEGGKGSSLLFEDEESNVAEDKRSNEAPEEDDDDDDIDPNTIDRLIELSSKLHLPADDVIDIINDVEKKKKDMPEPSNKSKGVASPPRDKPKKTTPSSYPQEPRPVQRQQYHQPAYLPKQDEAAWNEVLRGDEYPAPKWYRVKPNNKVSNYISPRTFHPLASHRYRHLPGPMVPRDGYYDKSPARDEELENYIERVLMEGPKVFQ